MQLPFTKEQFFNLFVAYNEALWAPPIALWIASVVVSVLLLSCRRPSDRWISGLLALHWAWSGVAYHLAFLTRINPAAWIFATLSSSRPHWRSLAIVPVIWSFVGGSAAILLDVRADYALPIAGLALAIFLTQRNSLIRFQRSIERASSAHR